MTEVAFSLPLSIYQAGILITTLKTAHESAQSYLKLNGAALSDFDRAMVENYLLDLHDLISLHETASSQRRSAVA
jgi:hypothetical protein